MLITLICTVYNTCSVSRLTCKTCTKNWNYTISEAKFTIHNTTATVVKQTAPQKGSPLSPGQRMLYEASEFRKPYLTSGNSSKTAYSCNAEFTVSFCPSTSANLCEGPTLFTEQGLVGSKSGPGYPSAQPKLKLVLVNSKLQMWGLQRQSTDIILNITDHSANLIRWASLRSF